MTTWISSSLGLFEREVRELKKEGIVLPDVVLAMQLLDSSALEQKDKQIVLTTVDYSKKDEMYAQMQSSLTKESFWRASHAM